jgi:hypothetical protein
MNTATHLLARILGKRLYTRRETYPGVPTTVVHRNIRRRKICISESAHGDTHPRIVAVLGVEYRRTACRVEPERELGSLVADANVFSGGAELLAVKRSFEACGKQRSAPE